MSTPAVYTFKGDRAKGQSDIHLVGHSDGYPRGAADIIPELSKVVTRIWDGETIDLAELNLPHIDGVQRRTSLKNSTPPTPFRYEIEMVDGKPVTVTALRHEPVISATFEERHKSARRALALIEEEMLAARNIPTYLELGRGNLSTIRKFELGDDPIGSCQPLDQCLDVLRNHDASPAELKKALEALQRLGKEAAPAVDEICKRLESARSNRKFDLELSLVKVLGNIPFHSEIAVPRLIEILKTTHKANGNGNGVLAKEVANTLSRFGTEASSAQDELKSSLRKWKKMYEAFPGQCSKHEAVKALCTAILLIGPNDQEAQTVADIRERAISAISEQEAGAKRTMEAIFGKSSDEEQ